MADQSHHIRRPSLLTGPFSTHCLKTRPEDDTAYMVGIGLDGSLAVRLKPHRRERIELEIEILDRAYWSGSCHAVVDFTIGIQCDVAWCISQSSLQ